MVIAFQISESELKSLKETCNVRHSPPWGLSIEEYERGVYLIGGTYEDLEKVLGNVRLLTLPLKIKVILGESE